LRARQSNPAHFQPCWIVSPLDRLCVAEIGSAQNALAMPDNSSRRDRRFFQAKLVSGELLPSLTGGKYFIAIIKGKPMLARVVRVRRN
jgi:hypothetical protein